MKKQNKGITLIALVITIIILLILAGVSISVLTESGLFEKAQEAEKKYDNSQAKENETLLGYESIIDEYLKEGFSAKKWDETATPENMFIWQSDDPTDEGYGVVIGYKSGIHGYTTLKFPSRCTKITFPEDLSYEGIDTATSRAFTYTISEIEIPPTTKEIGHSAFGDSKTKSFKGLKKVVLNEGLETIGSEAFAYCENLASITIPNSVKSVGNQAFTRCANLTNVTIPSNVSRIGAGAFSSCTALSSITIKNGVTTIGANAFSGCSELRNITIPDSVISIEDAAFSGCAYLTNITIPDSIESMGSNVFGNTNWYYAQPDGMIYIGKIAYGYKGTMPSNTNIEIQDGTKVIAGRAFYYYSNLTNITIPDSVTNIGLDAFYNTGWYDNQPDGLVYIGQIAYKYKGTMPSNTSIEIQEGTKVIAEGAFYYCTNLTSITIPNSVTNIGKLAFASCTSLTNVTIPDSVTSIGLDAFSSVPHITYNGTATGARWGAWAMN